jgi:hypothetical protein
MHREGRAVAPGVGIGGNAAACQNRDRTCAGVLHVNFVGSPDVVPTEALPTIIAARASAGIVTTPVGGRFVNLDVSSVTSPASRKELCLSIRPR